MLTSASTDDEDEEAGSIDYDSDYAPDLDCEMQIGEYGPDARTGPGCPLAAYARTHL